MNNQIFNCIAASIFGLNKSKFISPNDLSYFNKNTESFYQQFLYPLVTNSDKLQVKLTPFNYDNLVKVVSEVYFKCLENKVGVFFKFDNRLISENNLVKPFYFYRGNLSLLNEHLISVGGSRNAEIDSILDTIQLVKEAIKNNYVIVSGYAEGIDSVAHKTSLELGGKTIIVLPEGINNLRVKEWVREFANSNNILIISEFSPTEIWRSYNAMERNSTIIGLSNSYFAMQVGEKGGTYDAISKGLKHNVKIFFPDRIKFIPKEFELPKIIKINMSNFHNYFHHQKDQINIHKNTFNELNQINLF